MATELDRQAVHEEMERARRRFHRLLDDVTVADLRLPDTASGAFARLLDAARTPFDVVNYRGLRLGARIIPASRMGARFDQVISALQRRLDREPDSALRRGMHYPVSWDPFFTSYMTLYDIYRYPTKHFDFHSRQLTLRDPG